MKDELKSKADSSKEYLNKFSNEEYIFKNCIRQIQQFYRHIAWDNWVNEKNINAFKNGLYNSNLTLIRANELFNNLGLYMTLPRIPLCELALSDNQNLIQSFSEQDYVLQLSETKSKLNSELINSGRDQIYSALFLAAMKRDLTELSRLLKIVDRPKSNSYYFVDELPIFKGLLSGNKDQIFNTINDISSPRNHKRTNSNNGIYKNIVSFPAIGYAKIAWINDYQIEFSNRHIDNELLPVNTNMEFRNEIDSTIGRMTLESDYKFHGGAKRKIRNDVYDIFVFSTNDLSGKTCTVEHLIPNIYTLKPNFVGTKTGTEYQNGYLIGTNNITNAGSLFQSANEIKKIGFLRKKKANEILQKYLDEIDEISKTRRGGKIELDKDLSLVHIPDIIKPKLLKNLSKKKKDILTKLGEFCFKDVQFEKYLKEIKSLKNYDNDEEFGSTINYLSSKLQEEGLLQFFSLDWKTEISELDSLIEQSIRQNFDLKIELDVNSKFSAQSSISADGCFKEFSKELNSHCIEIRILDSGSDGYIFLLNKTEYNKEVSRLLNEIKFKQINNGL